MSLVPHSPDQTRVDVASRLRSALVAVGLVLAVILSSSMVPTGNADEASSIEGAVVGTQASSVDAWLDLCDAGGRLRGGPVQTGASGKFRFDGLTKGRSYWIRAFAPGYAWSRRGPVLPSGDQLTIALEPEMVLTGSVLDPEGHGVGGAQVRMKLVAAALDPQATTRPDGAFELRGLPADSGELVVRAANRGGDARARWVVRRGETRAAQSPVTVVLGRGSTIEGRIRTADSSLALEDLHVCAVPKERAHARSDDLDDWPAGRCEADGSFRIEGLPPGQHRLYVSFDESGGNDYSGPGLPTFVGSPEVPAGSRDAVFEVRRSR